MMGKVVVRWGDWWGLVEEIDGGLDVELCEELGGVSCGLVVDYGVGVDGSQWWGLGEEYYGLGLGERLYQGLRDEGLCR